MENILGKVAKQCLFKLGYEIMPAWRMENLDLATHLRELFKLLDIKCVFDVGANRGQYKDFLRNHVGYQGLVLSFEPVSSLAAHLAEKAKDDPNWHVLPFALGSSDTELSINVMATDQFSSFMTPDHSVINDYVYKNKIDHLETVTVRKLDTLLDELKKKWPMQNLYLKLDTQGFDLEVIKGAGKTMGEFLAFQSEVSVLKIYSEMPDFMSSIKVFNEQGFDISGMFAVSRDQYLRVVEFDAVMINRMAAKNDA